MPILWGMALGYLHIGHPGELVVVPHARASLSGRILVSAAIWAPQKPRMTPAATSAECPIPQ